MLHENPKLFKKLQEVLNPQPDAVRFFYAWYDYCHYIDDLVDGAIEKSTENLLTLCVKAAALYSSNFYTRYSAQLYPIVLTITNTYADSVKWEKSGEAWKRAHADVLRHCGNDLVMVIVGIVGGYEAMREVSELLREEAYRDHHTLDGIPV